MRALPLAPPRHRPEHPGLWARVLAISAALHAAAFAWVEVGRSPKTLPALASPPEPESAPAPAPDLTVDVTLLDDHTTAQIRGMDATPLRSAATRSHATSRGSAQISSSGPTGETPSSSGTGTAPGHSLMSMRGPEVSNGLSGDFVTSFLANSHPLEPAPAPSGELHPSGHGTYVAVVGGDVDHPKDGIATMHVAKDGTVKIDDSPDVTAHWVKPLPFIAGKMALDDAIMRRYGIDPYASAKLKWLDETRDERAAIGMANRKDMLAHADQFMQQNLDAMWAQIADPTQRKRALFMMWDEIAESGDDALVQAGEAARKYLVGFVRSHLPRGSAGAFTSDELAQLNAHRTSHATFTPYE